MHKLSVAHLLAKDIMVNPLVTFTSSTTIVEAVDLLIKHKISGAPLVDPKSNILLSVVTELDLMRLLAQAPMSQILLVHMDKIPAPENIVVVHPNDPYVEVFKKFLTNNFRRIFVIDDRRKVLGVISRRDVIRTIVEEERKAESV